jgi:hypothetical protein
LFDTHLINGIFAGCIANPDSSRFPLLARATGAWGHQVIRVFAPQSLADCRVRIIHFPGGSAVSDLDLLDYGFLAHEFGHDFLRRTDSPFVGLVEEEFTRFANGVRLRGIADKGAAKERASTLSTEIQAYWGPTENQHDWAHELANDVIGLWICGPAYVAAFTDYLDRADVDPFQVSLGHPPYAVRVTGLIAASKIWKIETCTDLLQVTQAKWNNEASGRVMPSNYANLTDPRIINIVVSCAHKTCSALGLVQCTDVGISDLRQKLLAGESIDLDVDLLLAAWIQFNALGEAAYAEWEKSVIAGNLAALKQGYR